MNDNVLVYYSDDHDVSADTELVYIEFFGDKSSICKVAISRAHAELLVSSIEAATADPDPESEADMRAASDEDRLQQEGA